VAQDPGRGATQITANYGIYWAGFHFGDVRVVITVRNSDYQMKGDGRFSVLGGLIFEWRGATTSVGKLDKKLIRSDYGHEKYSVVELETSSR